MYIVKVIEKDWGDPILSDL